VKQKNVNLPRREKRQMLQNFAGQTCCS